MPFARSSTGYPLEMQAAVERVLETNLPHTLVCESPSKARSLQSRFNQFRAACKRDLVEPPPFWTPGRLEAHRVFVEEMEGVEFATIGSHFVIRPRDKSPIAETLRKGLVPAAETSAAELPAKDSEADESMKTLLEKLK